MPVVLFNVWQFDGKGDKKALKYFIVRHFWGNRLVKWPLTHSLESPLDLLCVICVCVCVFVTEKKKAKVRLHNMCCWLLRRNLTVCCSNVSVCFGFGLDQTSKVYLNVLLNWERRWMVHHKWWTLLVILWCCYSYCRTWFLSMRPDLNWVKFTSKRAFLQRFDHTASNRNCSSPWKFMCKMLKHKNQLTLD